MRRYLLRLLLFISALAVILCSCNDEVTSDVVGDNVEEQFEDNGISEELSSETENITQGEKSTEHGGIGYSDADEKTPTIEADPEYKEYKIADTHIYGEGVTGESPVDAATFKIYDGCTIRNSKGQYLRIDLGLGKIYGDLELYELNFKLDIVYSDSAIDGEGVTLVVDVDEYTYEERYNFLIENMSYITVSVKDDEKFVITFDSDVEAFESEFVNFAKNRISFRGEGLRELIITPQKVNFCGNVVIESEEDQKELPPSERMHARATGREIVIEPYEAK